MSEDLLKICCFVIFVFSRSIIEPIRNIEFRNHQDHFNLAWARKLDMKSQTVTCESTLKSGYTFDLPYDILVVGVGSLSSTLGVPGVKEHAFFLKVLSLKTFCGDFFQIVLSH